jgi:hypothetical protein
MSDRKRTFVDRCIVGEATLDQLEDAEEQWHEGDDPRSLHEFLGLTWREYQKSAAGEGGLRGAIARKIARKTGGPVSGYTSQSLSTRDEAKHVVLVGKAMHEFATREEAIAFAREQVLAGVPIASIRHYIRQPLEVSVGI